MYMLGDGGVGSEREGPDLVRGEEGRRAGWGGNKVEESEA